MVLPYINPIMLDLGLIQIRWYSLAYIFGILIGWRLINLMIEKNQIPYGNLKKKHVSDYVPWVILAIAFGGRVGYVLFYNINFYFHNPLEILKIYRGGMSFHGALFLFVVFTYIFAKKNALSWKLLLDLASLVAPIGIFLGRIGNFLNSELYGRPTNLPWGVIYPTVDFKSRHPSQLYEAFLEGILLFFLLNFLNKKFNLLHFQLRLTSLFLIIYSVFRIFVEFFRTPDPQIGIIFSCLTMGQILSCITLIVGICIAKYSA